MVEIFVSSITLLKGKVTHSLEVTKEELSNRIIKDHVVCRNLYFSRDHHHTYSTEVAQHVVTDRAFLKWLTSVSVMSDQATSAWEFAGVRSSQTKHQRSSLISSTNQTGVKWYASTFSPPSCKVWQPFNALNHEEAMWSLTMTTLSFWKVQQNNELWD